MIQVWLSVRAHMTHLEETCRSEKFRALYDPPEQKALELFEGMASPATCLVTLPWEEL